MANRIPDFTRRLRYRQLRRMGFSREFATRNRDLSLRGYSELLTELLNESAHASTLRR